MQIFPLFCLFTLLDLSPDPAFQPNAADREFNSFTKKQLILIKRFYKKWKEKIIILLLYVIYFHFYWLQKLTKNLEMHKVKMIKCNIIKKLKPRSGLDEAQEVF